MNIAKRPPRVLAPADLQFGLSLDYAKKRSQDPHMDGTGLGFQAMEHGGYPDTEPQAIKLIEAEGRSCIYVPIMQNGKVVDSHGFLLDPEDE
jgi:hypothetical protein